MDMKTKWHKLTRINTEKRLAFCSGCEKNVNIEIRNRTSAGRINWRCNFNKHARTAEGKFRLYKKEECEKCGFKPIHKCQLDVDHIDNNHSNNQPENLVTLCANCHRLKTWYSHNKTLPT